MIITFLIPQFWKYQLKGVAVYEATSTYSLFFFEIVCYSLGLLFWFGSMKNVVLVAAASPVV